MMLEFIGSCDQGDYFQLHRLCGAVSGRVVILGDAADGVVLPEPLE